MVAGGRRPGRRARRQLRLSWLAFALLTGSSIAQGAEKEFIYALSGPPESLDSAKAASERSVYVTWLLCDTLVNVSRDGQRLEPGLAHSWALSSDGLQATVRLRPRVLFHDGTAVDANAVKASFDRQFRPSHELYSAEPRNSKERLLGELIDDIQVQDPLTLRFKLKYPGLHYLSQIDIVSPAALARLGKDFGRRPVCAGPFRFDSWAAGRIVLAAYDAYWDGRPRIDRVVFRFIQEARAAAEALLAGDVDFDPTLREAVFFERIRESPRARLLPVAGLNVFYLGFYTERFPFSNPLVRQAVARGINVPRAALFLGRGAALAAKGPLAPPMKAYDPTVSQPPYDADGAREILTRAGHGSGLTVRLVYYDSAAAYDSELAGAIQSDLRRIGIRVEFLGKPSSGDVAAAVQDREGDMFLYSWHVRAPYPERVLVPLFHSRAAETTNLTRYRNTSVDRLLDEALRLPEGPAQTKAYSQAQRLIVDDAPMIFLFHLARMAVYATRVQGLELNLGSLPQDKLTRVDLLSR